MKRKDWYVFFIIGILILNIYALFYIYKWNNNTCECAIDPKLKLIQYYLIFSICTCIFEVIVIFKYPKVYKKLRFILHGILLVLSILYTYISYLYTIQLQRKKCICIEPILIQIMYYISVLSTFLYSTMGIFLIIIGIAYWALKRKS